MQITKSEVLRCHKYETTEQGTANIFKNGKKLRMRAIVYCETKQSSPTASHNNIEIRIALEKINWVKTN